MAELTYTVTVASGNLYGGGTGNVFYLDGARNSTGPGTVNWVEGGTLRFDQSDSSNNGHLLKFHTVEDGTHASGGTLLDASAGFTTSGVPGLGDFSPSYSQLVVTSTTPRNLHYFCFCSNHYIFFHITKSLTMAL